MGWDGMGWDGMGWDGTGRDGMGWDGMGWDGMARTSWCMNRRNISLKKWECPTTMIDSCGENWICWMSSEMRSFTCMHVHVHVRMCM